MQIGTRWLIGETPPPRIGEEMTAAIRAVEAELEAYETTGWRWTLTWLEGSPVATLDDGTTVRVDLDGAVLVELAP